MKTQNRAVHAEPRSWDDYANSPLDEEPRDERGTLSLKLMPRLEACRLRFVTQPICFREHWQAFKTIRERPVVSPAVESKDRDLDVAWNQGQYIPAAKYAVVAISRETGDFVVISGGEAVFGPLRDWQRENKLPIYGPDAPDFLITAKVKRRKDGKHAIDYSVSAAPDGPKPLTEDEANRLARFLVAYDWKKQYARSTSDPACLTRLDIAHQG